MTNRSGGIVVWVWGGDRASVAIDGSRRFLIKASIDHWRVTSESEYLESQLARSVYMTRDEAITACVLVLLDEI